MDSVTFHFVPDANVAGYGYYAEVTTDQSITVTDNNGAEIVPAD